MQVHRHQKQGAGGTKAPPLSKKYTLAPQILPM